MIGPITDWLAKAHNWQPQQAATLPLAESLLARLTKALPADAPFFVRLWQPWLFCLCVQLFLASRTIGIRAACNGRGQGCLESSQHRLYAEALLSQGQQVQV